MNEKYNRLLWHSRRSSLELDLLLGGYVRNHYKTLPPELQEGYARLLEADDVLLHRWLIDGRSPPPRFRPVIRDILIHAKKNKP